MSYFDDQEDAWYANGCQGNIEDQDPWDVPDPPKQRRTRPPNKVHTSMGRSRSLLALSNLEEFAEWAVSEGFTREDTKGGWEVLRLRWPKMQPYIFFKRAGANHATTQAEGTQLATRWLRSRKEQGTA